MYFFGAIDIRIITINPPAMKLGHILPVIWAGDPFSSFMTYRYVLASMCAFVDLWVAKKSCIGTYSISVLECTPVRNERLVGRDIGY